MEIGLVRKIDIDQEMQQAYLDYAMSVIVSRALPDARDGLKPVHRRILYAMYDMGLRANTSYKKSARVVGEVLGKYHPHSDQAVYDAMARMAQDFSMRYPLVDGQGNFGSVDGDPPAAMRYTEARLADTAMDIMIDIEKGTADFNQNFDASLEEPTVLPAAIPNLLVNGATGIAVGMSTSVPPHNLGEVIDAIQYMLGNWSKLDEVNVEDLMQFIKGPDFPTGGVILGGLKEQGLSSAYGSGRGRIVVQSRAHVEDIGRGRERIIVTELPYMTNKASLIERIAKLAREGKLDGISDLRDESDRQGMRMVIELSKNAKAPKVLEALYKRTSMQNTFSIQMLALVNGEPLLLSLKQALKVYIDHRLEVIRRRSEHDLERARSRAHILEGLRVALQNLDDVINLIRRAPDVETARNRLMKKFNLSEIQANAILDMPLRRLAALERKKIEEEYKQVQKVIKDLEGLLKSPKKMRTVVGEELDAIKEKYSDRRRTEIIHLREDATAKDVLTVQDFSPNISTWVQVDAKGRISRTPEGTEARLWGRTAPRLVLRANTRDTLYLVGEEGKAAAVAVHSLPEAELSDQGVPFYSVSPLKAGTKLAAIFSLPPSNQRAESWYLLTGSKGGMVKKSPLEELPGPTAQSIRLAKVKDGDAIGWAELTNGSDEILMATASGMAIRFSEEDVRSMGLTAVGVNGIKLRAGDEVVGMKVADKKYEAFFLASDGSAKRVKISQFPIQGRYGMGVLAWKLEAGVKLLGLALDKPNREVTVHLARLAAKKNRLDDAPVRSRPASGKEVVEVRGDDRIVAITVPWEAPSGVGKSGSKKTSTPKKETPKPAAAKQIAMGLDEKELAKSKAASQKTTPKKPPPQSPGGKAKLKTKAKAKSKSTGKTPAKRATSKPKSSPKKKT